MKKTALLTKSVIGLSFAFVSSTSLAQKKIELKFNPENNAQYVMTTSMKNVSSQMGMDISADVNTTMKTTITSQKPNTLMTFLYSNISVDADMMGQKVSLNSDKQGGNNESLKKITNKPFSIIVDKNGDVTQVIGLDSLINAFGKNNPSANFINEESIKSSMNQFFSFYPNQPIAVGEKWNKEQTIFNNVKMKAQTTYTLEKVENSLAYITVAATISTDSVQKISFNGMEMTLSLKGNQNGQIIVDTKTGLFTTSTSQQVLDGSIGVMGQEIPTKVTTNIVNSFKKQ